MAITETAAELDVPVPVADVEEALDALGRRILSDPLSADLAELDELERRLAAAASQLADIAAVRADWATRLDAATQLANDVAVAIDRCASAASAAGQKIRDAPPAPSFEVERGLAEELERIAAMADTNDWTGVAGALASWHERARRALERAHSAAADQQALLATRDELRGRMRATRGQGRAAGAARGPDAALPALRCPRHAVHRADRPRSCGRTRGPLPARAFVRGGGVNCQRTGCGGTIVDGYCDECGLAPSATGRSQTEVDEVAVRPATTRTTRPRTTSTVATRRSRLGAGLVDIPTVPVSDPASAVMTDPTVAEHRRFCGRCDEPVGRSRDGRPGRTEGYCRSCGAPFSFVARLAPGEVLAGQYEVVGCLAHGGLGWIYLARDHNVSDRWVVLKGLLDTSDEHAMAAALAERRFLAEVEHPNIVKIHNFVEHGADGYIVMEYVNGVSLRAILEARRLANEGRTDPLPAEQAIAYCLEILPALGHLHDLGLVYCDFKPDNVIQTHGSLKLIDLGGVYRMDDEESPVYGTAGYQAPEIAQTGPTVASDLFTVGRTLAVLCTDIVGYQTTYRYTLPAARRRAAVHPLRLAVPLPRTGDGGRSRRALPERRRDERPAGRRPARDRLVQQRFAGTRPEHPLHPAWAGARSMPPTGRRCPPRWLIPTIRRRE